MKKLAFIIMFLLSAVPVFATQTILLENQNAEKLTILFKNKAIKEAAKVEDVTKTSLVVKSPIRSAFRQLMISPSGMSNSGLEKYELFFLQEGKNVIMSLTATSLSNDGSFTRFSYPWSAKNEAELLNKFKMMIEGYYVYNFFFVKKRKYLLVTGHNEQCGLEPGDKVLEINGMDSKEFTKQYGKRSLSEPQKNSTLKLKVLRGENSFETVLKSVYVKPYTINPLF